MIRSIGGRRVTRLGSGYNQPCLICGDVARGRVPVDVRFKKDGEEQHEERLVDLCEPHLEELAGSADREGFLSAEE